MIRVLVGNSALQRKVGDLGVHALTLERETSTGVLANISREFANLSENSPILSEHLPNLSDLAILKPIVPGFDQLCPGNRRN